MNKLPDCHPSMFEPPWWVNILNIILLPLMLVLIPIRLLLITVICEPLKLQDRKNKFCEFICNVLYF